MSNKMCNPGLAVTILFASLILSACGGGSGSSSSSDGDANTLKPGLYEANVEYVDGNPAQSATTYLSPTGTFAVIFRGNTGISIGKLSFDGTKISGTSHDYRQVGPEGFIEDKGVEEGTISGTIRSQESATFSTSDAAGDVNTKVTLRRSNLPSEVGISLERFYGLYEMGVSEVVLDVDQNGSLFAQFPTSSCALVGTESLSVPNSSINVFNITYTISGCDNEIRDGQYSGGGFFVPGDQQQQIVFITHNGDVAMKFQATKITQ